MRRSQIANRGIETRGSRQFVGLSADTSGRGEKTQITRLQKRSIATPVDRTLIVPAKEEIN